VSHVSRGICGCAFSRVAHDGVGNGDEHSGVQDAAGVGELVVNQQPDDGGIVEGLVHGSDEFE
jgi:hypothetical protein